MRTDGVFNVHKITIKHPVNRPFRLVPFGDLHFDSPAFCQDTWAEFRKRLAKNNPVTYYLGMGDYVDGYSTSERRVIYSDSLHESTRRRQEDDDKLRVTTLANQLKPIKGRIIGLLGGNHYQSYMDGSTSDMLLARKLETRYLGVCAAIRVSIECVQRTGSKGGPHGVTFDIFAHHGRGGGVTAGGKFNSVEKMANHADADIYLMGDNHARGAFPLGDRLYLVNDPSNGVVLKARKRWIGRTGSFLRGYEPGVASYVVDGCMPPANLGWIEFEITPTRGTSHSGSRPMGVDINAWQ
jgi:hypothetical protein